MPICPTHFQREDRSLRATAQTVTSESDYSANRLLVALGRRDRALIEPDLVLKLLGRGQVLFEPGEDVETTYFPCRGTMGSWLVVSADGREVEAATIGREGAIGGIVTAGHKTGLRRGGIQIRGASFSVSTTPLDDAKTRSAVFH